MRTIDTSRTKAGDPAVEQIVSDIHDMMVGFRCAGTARLVKSGVSMTHMHVMWLLQHHGALPMSRLAELLDVSLSNATGIIDRMEERELVERVRVPDDRRVVLVRIGQKGIDAIEQTESLKHDRLTSILGRLDAAQVDRVAAALDDIRAAVAAEFGPDYLAGHDHLHHPEPTRGTDI